MLKLSLKLSLLLLVLFCFSFSAYSQENDPLLTSEMETPTIAPILKQLYRISIEQAKKSADPQTELEKVFSQIIDDLETYYLNEAKTTDEIYQAQLNEQKINSDRRVQEVQEKAEQELALLRQRIEITSQMKTNQALENAGWFSAGLLTGYSLNELKDDLIPE